MRAFFLELRAALRIDQARNGIGKLALRITIGGIALRLDEYRPAGAQAAQRIVESGVIATNSAGVAESRSGPRKRAVRWNDPSLLRTTPLSTSAAQGR